MSEDVKIGIVMAVMVLGCVVAVVAFASIPVVTGGYYVEPLTLRDGYCVRLHVDQFRDPCIIGCTPREEPLTLERAKELADSFNRVQFVRAK